MMFEYNCILLNDTIRKVFTPILKEGRTLYIMKTTDGELTSPFPLSNKALEYIIKTNERELWVKYGLN